VANWSKGLEMKRGGRERGGKKGSGFGKLFGSRAIGHTLESVKGGGCPASVIKVFP